jgi:hypothetical protein
MISKVWDGVLMFFTGSHLQIAPKSAYLSLTIDFYRFLGSLPSQLESQAKNHLNHGVFQASASVMS